MILEMEKADSSLTNTEPRNIRAAFAQKDTVIFYRRGMSR